jgi:hypothetical protein
MTFGLILQVDIKSYEVCYYKTMSDTIDIEGKTYAVSGYADDGLPIIKANAVSTQDGVDDDGNPKINVNINVPVADLLGTPGEVS